MVRYLLLYFSFLCIGAPAFSQQKWTVAQLFHKVEQHYENLKVYHYVSAYSFYENTNSKIPIEKKSGLIIRKNNVIYQKLTGIESINFGDYNVVVDNGEKKIQIVKNKSSTSPLILNSYLNFFPTKKIIQNPDYWICELSADKALLTSQYSRIRFFIAKKDFSLLKQVFYMNGTQEFKKNNKTVKINDPRLEITLLDRSDAKSVTPSLIRSDYFTIKDKKIKPSKRFATYKLITQ
ncbi:hypothetical protein [Flavobacterium sp. GT3R68]|uniref:hypothetical protein n=1 Tax=Flavobacterium sp. GT3R68 TaxID=2594437 RepID=UPI000F874CAF|nr:hypothetical protein [Flavobacterium sp. GT3R68]RTY91781.1 hypothetical protein EKL32_18120 [Flavobacterium sp. GSN2]TRW90121.1 hypothetical protein FNW07_11730 [Flavobacterium sp. GT3R68]